MPKKILQKILILLMVTAINMLSITARSQPAVAKWKLDTANRQFNRNNNPQFLWGIMSSAKDDAGFQSMKEMGFNVFTTWYTATTGEPEDALKYAELADKYDIGLIVNLSNFIAGYESDILPDWLSGQELVTAQKALLYQGSRSTKRFCYAFHKDNGEYPQSIKDLTFEQKSLLIEEYFNKNKPTLTAVITNSVISNNLVGFYLIDEPITKESRILGEHMYRLVHKLAPSASVFNCYSPSELNDFDPPYIMETSWTAWADVIGTDAYFNPKSRNSVRRSVDYVTNNVGLVERRAKNENKVNWVVLATDANTTWMIESGAEYTKKSQFLQTYIAIIQKAKAIIYWRYPFKDVLRTTGWFKELSIHIEKLGPIAMQPVIEQDIIYNQLYALGKRYVTGHFPDVLVRLMRDPEGQYVLLAANAENHSVNIKVSSNLLENGSIISSLFDSATYKITEHSFINTIDAGGTRAYIFTSSVLLDTPVVINVNSLIRTAVN